MKEIILLLKKIFFSEKSYKFYKRLLIFLILLNILGMVCFIFTFAHGGKIYYMGKYYEPEDSFKLLKEYGNYKSSDDVSLIIGPSEWINYCDYNIKTELKNGILINSEDELKELYNKILKEMPIECSLDEHRNYYYEQDFYYEFDDLVKEINIDDFEHNSLIVLVYNNMTNVCGLKVTDVNLSDNKATIDIAISEGEAFYTKSGLLGESIDRNTMLVVIKTEKITQDSNIEINIEKYDCYIQEKKMESYIC